MDIVAISKYNSCYLAKLFSLFHPTSNMKANIGQSELVYYKHFVFSAFPEQNYPIPETECSIEKSSHGVNLS